MKKTVITICILTCLALVFPVTVGAMALATPAQFDNTFLGELSCKIERLESIDQPKIIVVGGSSVAFGLRSDIMEQQLGMPVVNFGLYASLGTKLMVDLSKANIGEGDIIIIAPEQDAQTLSMYFNADSAWKAFDGNFKNLKYVGEDDIASLAGGLMKFASEKYKYLQAGEKPAVSGVYTKDAFNEYCDIAYERPSNTMFGSYDKNTPISFDQSVISQDFIDYLNDYAAYARSRGADVFFSFSPMNRAALTQDATQEQIYDYFCLLQQKLDFPVISSPETYLMEPNWFYDSNFHMNDAGAIVHTKHLINDLILALRLDKTCTVETPEMPTLSGQGDAQQGNSDLFTFNATDEGVEITGLTDKGLTETIIEVPTTINGQSVIAISEGAFSSNTAVEKIILNHGIAYIADGAFEGCTALKELVVNSTDPATIRVGEELLRGADACRIYVPQGSYGTYSTDYYWAFYCDSSVLDELA